MMNLMGFEYCRQLWRLHGTITTTVTITTVVMMPAEPKTYKRKSTQFKPLTAMQELIASHTSKRLKTRLRQRLTQDSPQIQRQLKPVS